MNTQTVGNKEESVKNKFSFINKLKQNPKMLLLIVGAAAIAIVIVALLWAKEESYGVLFSNMSDKDGGEIVTQLEKMNIPYQFSSSGTAILVPENKVHDTRLRLAQQGLPKGGSVGFELLDKERFGMSQFTEQINYQRALEGELSRTISTISSIDNARVHLALPKPSLFVRERKLPSASVTLSLLPGRALSQGQIDAIIHLISSSVSELPADKVTIIDQNGNLLTSEASRNINLNASQIEFAERIEDRVRQRIEKILEPVVGKNNVNVQVTADVDFSRQESTTETYDPNSNVENQTIRSKQQVENSQSSASSGIGGVPGALSNQPVPSASAQIDGNEDPSKSTDTEKKQKPHSLQLNNTVNFEVNRQIVHSQTPEGRIKRLSVAVLVNYKTVEPVATTADLENDTENTEETANVTSPRFQQLESDVLKNIEELARQSMGFSEQRGDSLTVANLKFTDQTQPVEETPIWKTPEFYDLLTTYGRYLVFALIAWIVWRKVVKPIGLKLQTQLLPVESDKSIEQPVEESYQNYSHHNKQQQKIFEDSMQQQQYIREMVEKDPRVMALIIRSWMNKEGNNK